MIMKVFPVSDHDKWMAGMRVTFNLLLLAQLIITRNHFPV